MELKLDDHCLIYAYFRVFISGQLHLFHAFKLGVVFQLGDEEYSPISPPGILEIVCEDFVSDESGIFRGG